MLRDSNLFFSVYNTNPFQLKRIQLPRRVVVDDLVALRRVEVEGHMHKK